MIINPDILRKDMIQLLNLIDNQIKEVQDFAEGHDIRPEEVRDANGNWVMIPLLTAKVQGLAALVTLNDREKKK